MDFPIAATGQQRLTLFQRMSRLINPYPPIGLIFGLAILFLAVVGPLNYLYLWKVRRTLLLVITVPGISFGFLALIVGTGYLIKGTSTVAHSARLLSTRSGVGVARETQLYTLFSPSTRSYDLVFEPGTYGPCGRGLAWEESNYAYNASHSTLPTLTFETGTGLTVRGLKSGQWQNWQIETRAIRDLGKGIRFSVESGRVRIANDSPRHIVRGLCIQTGAAAFVAPFGDVAPGKSSDTPVPAVSGSAVEALGFPLDSLGDGLLRSWLEPFTRPPGFPASVGGSEASQRFLVCLLRNEGETVSVDARLSSRSQTLTLLHVAEGP